MSNDKTTTADLIDAALKVFTREELQSMSKVSRTNLGILIERRLKEDGPPPTVAELEGIRMLVEDYLWHPAFDK